MNSKTQSDSDVPVINAKSESEVMVAIRDTKLKIMCSKITVEPVIICYIVPVNLLFIATQNLNLEKACAVNLNYSTSVCAALTSRNKSGYNVTEEQSVQALVAMVNGYVSSIQGFLIFLSLLILGSWSDKNCRRKPFMIIPSLGDIITAVLLIFSLIFYYQIPVEFNIFAEAVPQSVAGGAYSFFTATASYISEDPNAERRATKIGRMGVIIVICYLIGTAVGGVLYDYLSHYQVYVIIIVLHCIGIAYTHFNIKEVRHKNEKKKNVFMDIFKFSHIGNTLKLIFTKGKKEKRIKIWLTLLCVWLSNGLFIGTDSFNSFAFGDINILNFKVKGWWSIYTLDIALVGTKHCLAYM